MGTTNGVNFVKLKSVFDYINQQQPDRGYWLGLLDSATKWWDTHLSLGGKFKAWAIIHYQIGELGKTREWVSELYTTSTLLIAALGLAVAARLTLTWTGALATLAVAWAIYRSLELLSRLLGWVFTHKDKLHSVQRSLFGILLNIAELSLLFTTLDISLAGKLPSGKVEAFIDGMVDLVTFSHHSPISLSISGVIEVSRIFFGMLLVLIVVGSLAGGVVRRALADEKE